MSSLVERLEAIIKEKGLNFKRVERECGLGNGTIKRWADQSPRLDRLVLVSDYLKVSLDYLVHGNLQSEISLNGDSAFTCDGVPLSAMETDLVAMLRLLPDESQKEVFDLVHFKYTRITGGEKESIFWTYTDESINDKSGPIGSHEAHEGTA